MMLWFSKTDKTLRIKKMIEKHITVSLFQQYIWLIRRIIFSEYFLWIMLSLLISGGFLFDLYYYEPIYDAKGDFRGALLNPFSGVVKSHYTNILLSILFLLFPLLYFQIFGKLPTQALRDGTGFLKNKNVVVHGSGNIINFENDKEKNSNKSEFSKLDESNLAEVDLLNKLVTSSEKLSNKIYTRSGVYLMFGVLIAFGGVLYFSFQSITPPSNADTAQNLILLAPKFGILFFIEFIAFFFLKQYRAAMDEFRYYDSIKRSRESQLAIFLIATKTFQEKNFITVVDKMNFYKSIDKLSAGETTELLEAYKSNKNEFDILKEKISNEVKLAKKVTKATAVT